METNNSLQEIIIKSNIKSLSIAGIVTILSIAAFIMSWAAIGSIMLITGIILFFVKPKQAFYSKTGSKVNKYSGYFDKEQVSRLEKIVRGGFSEEDAAFKLQHSGSGKIDVMASLDKEFVAVQLFVYVPHDYQKTTDYIKYYGPQAAQLIDFLEKCRK